MPRKGRKPTSGSFKKGHKGFRTKESYIKAGKKVSKTRKGKPNWYQVKGVLHPSWIDGRSKNKEYIKKRNKKWIDENRIYKNFLNSRRRAMKLRAEGSHTFGEWELLRKQYGYKCPACGKKESEITLTEDHIIPLIKGGSDYIENIQPLCRSCNSIKHTKIIKY